MVNTLRPRKNDRHFTAAIFKYIFLNENIWILLKISLKLVPNGPINNAPALVQIMAWCRPGDKPLSGPMMDSSLKHLCITRPQLLKILVWHLTTNNTNDYTVHWYIFLLSGSNMLTTKSTRMEDNIIECIKWCISSHKIESWRWLHILIYSLLLCKDANCLPYWNIFHNKNVYWQSVWMLHSCGKERNDMDIGFASRLLHWGVVMHLCISELDDDWSRFGTSPLPDILLTHHPGQNGHHFTEEILGAFS